MKIARVNEMRTLDRRAIEELGIKEELLMENAGLAAYFVIARELGVQSKSFLIFCGVGNNGGDGLVLARLLHANGALVKVLILGDRSRFKGAAKINYDIVAGLPVDLSELHDVMLVQQDIQRADAIIDAIFGTGLDREVSGMYKEVISVINSSHKIVFSLDIPSGVNGDTGLAQGSAIRANSTITFGLPKLGNVLLPGFEYGGKLFVSHISFPPSLHATESIKIGTNDPVPLMKRRLDAHKGDYCKVLFIAGAANYLGAPYFAAMSFLKAGGGLSYLAAPETVTSFIAVKGNEIVFLPQKSTASGSIALENKDKLLEFAHTVDMVVMGPGLSLNEETQQLVRELTAAIPKPLLIDGDGISAVAQNLDCLKRRAAPTILTPHPGEMARLTQMSIGDVVERRIDVLQSMTQILQAMIVFKGAHSLIGFPDERVFVNLSGNPGMATAGSGDVLTGTIAGMYGLGLKIEDAVRMGVFVHGLAGDLAANAKGQDGMVAGDIMEALPQALIMCREEFNALAENHYQRIFRI